MDFLAAAVDIMVGVLRKLLVTAKPNVMDVPSFEDVDVGPWQRKGTSLFKRFLYHDGTNLVLEVEIGVERSDEARLIHRSVAFTLTPGFGLNGPARVRFSNSGAGDTDRWIDVEIPTSDDGQTRIEVQNQFLSDRVFSVLCSEARYDFTLAEGDRPIIHLSVPSEAGLMTLYQSLKVHLSDL